MSDTHTESVASAARVVSTTSRRQLLKSGRRAVGALVVASTTSLLPFSSVFATARQTVNAVNPTLVRQFASAGATVTRGVIISRAKTWVSAQIPYSQVNYYNGYREDCSGYVSMAWGLGTPGLTTYTLPSVSYQIDKVALQ